MRLRTLFVSLSVSAVSFAGPIASSLAVPAHAEPLGLEVEGPDPLDAAADQAYRDGVKAARAGRYVDALNKFEAALPRKSKEPDLFYNLVQMAKAKTAWDKVALYANGFLALSPKGEDAATMGRLITEARERMRVRGTPLTKLALTVEPAGAAVFVNDTPVQLASAELPTGSYKLRVEHPGFIPVERTLTVGKAAAVAVQLERLVLKGKVVFDVTPKDGVAVFVDDEMKGELPTVAELELDSAKRYLVRFEKPGFDNWVRYVQPQPNGKVVVQAKLEAVAAASPKAPTPGSN